MNTTQNKSLTWVLVKSLLVSTILLAGLLANAQKGLYRPTFKPVAGIGISSSASCNSFGLQHVPYISVHLGQRAELWGGAMLHKSSFRFTGIQSRLLFYFLRPEDSHSGKTTLYNMVIVENHMNQSFSKKWVEIEDWTSRNSEFKDVDFSAIRFKGTQVSLGFGVRHNFTDRFSANFNLAISYFEASRNNYQNVQLYYESKGLGLHLSAGVQYSFGKYSH